MAVVNLPCIVALDALLTMVNVTKAVARLGLTQSAMSHALRQLREVMAAPPSPTPLGA